MHTGLVSRSLTISHWSSTETTLEKSTDGEHAHVCAHGTCGREYEEANVAHMIDVQTA